MAKQARKTARKGKAKAKAPKTAPKTARKATTGSTNQARVLAAFGGRARTVEQVCEQTGLSPRQVRASIDRLRAGGVRLKGEGRGTFKAA